MSQKTSSQKHIYNYKEFENQENKHDSKNNLFFKDLNNNTISTLNDISSPKRMTMTLQPSKSMNSLNQSD